MAFAGRIVDGTYEPGILDIGWLTGKVVLFILVAITGVMHGIKSRKRGALAKECKVRANYDHLGPFRPTLWVHWELMANVANGIIQKSGLPITATTDLGLYSQVAGGWMRFVTNNAQFVWFSDSGGGSSARMILSPAGNLSIAGSVSKAGGSFKIDHPLDPAGKYLYHSFVESPDMMNIYNGVVTLDAKGQAWMFCTHPMKPRMLRAV